MNALCYLYPHRRCDEKSQRTRWVPDKHYWNSVSISPKAARPELRQVPDSSPGTWVWCRFQVFAQAINWFPDPFGCTSLVTNIPMKNKLIKCENPPHNYSPSLKEKLRISWTWLGLSFIFIPLLVVDPNLVDLISSKKFCRSSFYGSSLLDYTIMKI